jgi:ABC-type phosphate/phosphonate transport system substrate-binding protein
MKKHPVNKMFVAALSLVLIASCSDEKSSTNSDAAKKIPISHTLLGSSTTSSDKQKFEHSFEKQCVERELKNSVNPDSDKARVSRDCECVATFMMKDLTAIEAEKFLIEHENAQSLTIKYENAAYHCLQQKAPPQAAHLFGKP